MPRAGDAVPLSFPVPGPPSMAHDPLTASTTLCLAGPAGHGKSLLVRRLHEEPGDVLSGKLGTTTSRLHTPRRRWLAIDARHESELLREIVGGGIEAPVALVVVDVRGAAAAPVGATLAFLRLLGVRDTVVAVNRMDLVDWREDAYTLSLIHI